MKIKCLSAYLILFVTSASAEPLKVGAVLPLSGVSSDYGTSIVNSIQLAIEDHPELFKSIKFITEDAGYDSAKAVTAFNKLVDSDRVDLIYTWGVNFCKAVSPLAERRKIPSIGQCIDPGSSRGRDFFVRFMNKSDEYLDLQAEYLLTRSLKKLAIVLTENPYQEEMLGALKRHLRPGQSVEVIQSYLPSSTDLRDGVLKLRSGSFDAVGVFLSPGQISNFFRLLREQRVDMPAFGTNFFESQSEVDAANGAMNGAVFVNNSYSAEYFDRYEARFGKATQPGFGALAYEFAMFVARTVRVPESSKLSGIAILDSLRRLTSWTPGYAAGPYRFVQSEDAGGYVEFPLTIRRICAGRMVDVDRVNWGSDKCP